MSKTSDTSLLPICSLCCLAGLTANSQNLQLHYDRRHTVAPRTNPENFPTLYFEYWKAQDSGQRNPGIFIKPGDFLLKTEADLLGSGNNIGKFYMQISQSFRAWTPRIFLQLQYSYYITNTYQAGAEIPWHWKNAWLTTILDYKFVSYTNPTNDPILTQYWYRGFFHYKLEFAGDFSIWTENRNHGDEATAALKGKRFFFFAEPQLWFNLTHALALGSKINCYYHVNTPANVFQAYPTLAARLKL